jgi:hypothetical protein
MPEFRCRICYGAKTYLDTYRAIGPELTVFPNQRSLQTIFIVALCVGLFTFVLNSTKTLVSIPAKSRICQSHHNKVANWHCCRQRTCDQPEKSFHLTRKLATPSSTVNAAKAGSGDGECIGMRQELLSLGLQPDSIVWNSVESLKPGRSRWPD